MIHSGITLLTFASTTLLVISLGMLAYDWVFRYHFAIKDRLNELSDASEDQHDFAVQRHRAAAQSDTPWHHVPGRNGCTI